ncbi:MAG: hypothetical protein IKP24_02730 [Alphaproteobacteria bacterium]|nr:hypothetical protein [Alphaproteobacteria bacterium]
MKILNKSLSKKNQSGNMLVELLLSVSLAMLIIPFVFKYQRGAIERRENIEITKQMTEIQGALERYIIDNRETLLKPLGRNIVRVEIGELAKYGLGDGIINAPDTKYQLRVLKSKDFNGQSTLQGVVVYESEKISPFRTHQILNLANGHVGFVDGNKAYGANGTWRASVADIGIDAKNGIVTTTTINRDNALYLWRVPSQNPDDATMRSSLNLGSHDVLNVRKMAFVSGSFDEFLTIGKLNTRNLIFNNRTTVDSEFYTKSATVSGSLTSDSRNLEITGRLSLTDTGKFSSFTTNDLLVTNLTLPNLSIDNPERKPVILTVNGSVKMTYGSVNATHVTVGYAGSITPRLIVSSKITDPTNPGYYWDASTSSAVFSDLYLGDLNRMISFLPKKEFDSTTFAGRRFGAIAANANATVADFQNALNDIANDVRAKYRLLKLQ